MSHARAPGNEPSPPDRKGGLTHNTLRGLAWTLVGTGGQAMIRLLVLVILARLLTPRDFGIVSAALVVIGFTTIFSQLGVGPAIVQRPSLDAAHLRTGFTLSLLFGSVTTGLIWLLAPAAASFFRMAELAPVVRVLSVTFVASGVSIVAESLLQREMQFRRLAVINLIAYSAGYGGVGLPLAFLGWGIWALVGAQIAQTFLKTSITLIARPHPWRPSIDRGAAGELLSFGGGHTAARIGNYLASQADNMVVGRWLGAAALGVYDRAYQLMTAPAMVFGEMLDRVMFPAMVKVQDQPARLAVAYRRSVALIALMILPLSAALFFLAPHVVLVFLGPAWTEVVAPFRILAVGLLPRTSYKMSDSLVRATGAVYRRAWRQVAYAGMVGAGAWIGRYWGVSGVAFGVLVAIAMNFLAMAHLSLEITGMTWRHLRAAHRPALTLTAVIGAAAWGATATLTRLGLAPFMVLLLASITALVAMALSLRYASHRVLGADGAWMLRTLSTYLPSGFNPLLKFGLGME